MHGSAECERCGQRRRHPAGPALLIGRFVATIITMHLTIEYSITRYQSKKKLCSGPALPIIYLSSSLSGGASSQKSCYRTLFYTGSGQGRRLGDARGPRRLCNTKT